ncbi:tetratricopeptide repeat protein [Candidatus Poribacteria bacterium]|nr:tetratricopeptide repeat protein [Candidatus Poribacteria bacterium]MYK23629.1 tetratricopeptide repeat protein [Candidatus Poribacteria bacterium]
MIKGKCIYCKEVKDLNEEHAFPDSLRQKGIAKWVIRKHLCTDCNSQLGKLDVVLSRRSPLAYLWERVQSGLGNETNALRSSIFGKRIDGINPVRLFLSNPVYDDHILLHDFIVESNDNEKNATEYTVTALQPQIILTLHIGEQSERKIIVKNREEFNAISLDGDFITDYNEQDDVYCIFGNTYVFPPKAANRFFRKVDEFKSKFMKDSPITQYSSLVLFPEEDKYQGKAKDFYNAFQGEVKEDIPAKKFQNPEVFTQTVQAVSDPKSIPEFLRAIAKTAFHCFLFHYPKFTGHEPIFDSIKEFISTGTPNKFVAQCRNAETADLVYDSTEHRHVFYFFLQGNDIGCRIDFFTGLLPIQFSYEVILAGNPEKSHPICDCVESVPFSVHPESQMKKRIHPVTDLGVVRKPRWGDGVLWLPRSTRGNDAVFYNNRGIDYRKEGELDLAIKDFDKAIELNPEFAEAYNNRGNAYDNKGDFDKAIVNFNTAIKFKSDFVEAYVNRGVAYGKRDEFNKAINDFTTAIDTDPGHAGAYYNRGNAYLLKGDFDKAIEDYNMSIELSPDDAQSYCHRGLVWLHLKKWDKAKTDLTAAKNKGVDIIAAFHNLYRDVATFERRNSVKLPKDIVAMLRQYPVNSFTTTQRVLTADGETQESYAVLELLEKFRNTGKPLSEYLHGQSSRGITTGCNEAFIVAEATRDALIAEHSSSSEILKPFLMARDIQRWRVKPTDELRREPQDKWLIFAHRGVDINAYPAIKKHLGKYRNALEKRSGKQEWYELQTAPTDTTRFTQPKCLYADMASETAFAFDDEGYYVGNPASLLPTSELWLLGVLNTRAVSWFYARTAPQVRGPFLKFVPRYVSQIPIPDMESEQQALIHKIVEYILYLKKQPTVNSRDLKYARDRVMVGYFNRIIDGIVYEAYLPDSLHKGKKHFFQPLFDEQLPQLEEIQGDKMSAFRDIFEQLYEKTHPVAVDLFFMSSVKPIRIIESRT